MPRAAPAAAAHAVTLRGQPVSQCAHPVRHVLLLERQQTAAVEQQRRVGRLIRVLRKQEAPVSLASEHLGLRASSLAAYCQHIALGTVMGIEISDCGGSPMAASLRLATFAAIVLWGVAINVLHDVCQRQFCAVVTGHRRLLLGGGPPP